jgi:hypothetical protein
MRTGHVILAFQIALFAASCSTEDGSNGDVRREEKALLTRLQRDHRSGLAEWDATTRYSLAMADLNSDGSQEALVYISGRYHCGSGGCDLLILTRDANGWREVSSLSITWPPIRLMETRTNGWRDIGVFVRGGGILPGYEALLTFEGGSYPTNPSMPPARPARPGAPGDVLIPQGAPGFPLFP